MLIAIAALQGMYVHLCMQEQGVGYKLYVQGDICMCHVCMSKVYAYCDCCEATHACLGVCVGLKYPFLPSQLLCTTCLNPNALATPGVCIAVPLQSVLKHSCFKDWPDCCHEHSSLVTQKYACVIDGVHILLSVCTKEKGG
jgi:hypothetical protein